MLNTNKEREILAFVDKVIADGPYKPEWSSLVTAPVPAWFRQRRLGIFIHWGVYSVPANSNEWYSRNMYIAGDPAFEHHVKTYGSQSEFGYKDFIPMFRAERFDAGEWVSLFKKAGAGYIFPVAEHHDGFQMYASELSDWNAADMGPKRDVLGELKQAAQERDLMFCASSHRAEHWFFMGHGKDFDSDIREPLHRGDFYWPAMPEANHFDLRSEPYPTEEYLNDWLARTAELIVNYRPKLLYFDWWLLHQSFKPYLKMLAAFYYNCGKQWGEDVMICYKHDAMMFGSGIVEVERGSFAEAKPYAWQTDTAVARNSWCYTDSLDYKSSEEIIWTLVDVVSKGGNLLLNVGPRADGVIPEGDRRILEDMAAWMQVNGEIIDGSRPWRKSQEGPTHCADGQFQDGKAKSYTSRDYRFIAANGALYAVAMVCPEDGQFTVKAFGDSPDQNLPEFHDLIRDVGILGYSEKIEWRKDAEGLHISAPGIRSKMPVVIRISVE